MSEVIYKYAAIKLIKKYFELIELNPDLLVDAIASFPDCMSDVDEWCPDCKEYDNEKRCCPRFNRVISNTVKELQDNFVMTGISGTLLVTVDNLEDINRIIIYDDNHDLGHVFYPDECNCEREAIRDEV